MSRFAALLRDLESAGGTRDKERLLRNYVLDHVGAAAAASASLAWSIRLLSGVGLGRRLAATRVREALALASGLPLWLVEESHESVGDLAETCALLLQDMPASGPAASTADLHATVAMAMAVLQSGPEAQAALLSYWQSTHPGARFAHTKLLTGGLRVGVSRGLVARVLSGWLEVPSAAMAQQLSVFLATRPCPRAVPAAWDRLVQQCQAMAAGQGDAEPPGPRPFFLAQPLPSDMDPEALEAQLGQAQNWQLEWKWDGIRAQAWIAEVDGRTQVQLWSRGEEDISQSFPDLCAALAGLPSGHLLDGEILALAVGGGEGEVEPQSEGHGDGRVAPFSALQLRLGRRSPSAAFCAEHPVTLRAYDLLRDASGDTRALTLSERRARLEGLMATPAARAAAPALSLSPVLACTSWQQAAQWRSQARAVGVEGLMIKRRDAAYGVGRTKASAEGEVWKWKVDPWSIDAVLVYAQRGHGRRAGLYTDYGFALWDRSRSPAQLVPFAKAYSGLTDDEIREVDAVIRKTILEKFGPVRSVAPTLVMELAFEGVMASRRHKSGVAVRFPRILRLRPDKRVEEANSLDDLRAMLPDGHAHD